MNPMSIVAVVVSVFAAMWIRDRFIAAGGLSGVRSKLAAALDPKPAKRSTSKASTRKAAAAAPEGGSGLTLVLVAFVAVLGYLVYQNGLPFDSGPAEPAIVVPAGTPDMRQVFATNPDRQQAAADALHAAGLLTGLANFVEYDGTKPQPKLTTDGAIEDLRVEMREYQQRGGSFQARYDKFGEVVGGYLFQQLGVENEDLTPSRRKQWAELCRNLGAACRKAAAELLN